VILLSKILLFLNLEKWH